MHILSIWCNSSCLLCALRAGLDSLGPLPNGLQGTARRPSFPDGLNHHSAYRQRASPVNTGAPATEGSGTPPVGSTPPQVVHVPQPPWSYALQKANDPRAALHGGHNGHHASLSRHRRANSGGSAPTTYLMSSGLSHSRVSSIASSMQSLDSNAVD